MDERCPRSTTPNPDPHETALRRSRAREVALEQLAASPRLGPVMKEAATKELAVQKRETALSLRALAQQANSCCTQDSMYPGFICGPGAFAPIEEQRRFLNALEAMPQCYADIRQEIKNVKDAIEWRKSYEKRRPGRKA